MDLTAVILLLLGLAIGSGAVALRRRPPAPAYDATIAETLRRLDAELRSIETSRAEAYGGLVAGLGHVQASSEELRRETAALVTALRAPATRGRWGEMQLRRVIEAAGALEHCDFTEQPTTTTADGTLRPDVVVHLAGGKNVVIDAKVPCAAYLEAIEARDDATRADRLRAHARQLREHVRALGAKAYWERFDPAPEFVVLFVPGDAFLDAALTEDASLQEFAFASDVVLASPSTLVALIRTIAYTWRQEALADGAREISNLGRELYGRLATLGGHLDKLGRSLATSVESYNQTVGSLEARVLVTARRFAALGVSSGALAGPEQVDATPRVLGAPELVAAERSSGEPVVRLAAAEGG